MEFTAVSPLTIRRDAEELEMAGLVTRIPGAIRPVEGHGFTLEPAFLNRTAANARQTVHRPGGRRSLPAGLHHHDRHRADDAGVQPAADHSRGAHRSDLVVATQSAGIHDLYVLAGRVRPAELSIVGPQAYTWARGRPIDQLFLGAAAVAGEVSDYSVDDAYTKRTFISRAGDIVLLCDSSKFDRKAGAVVCNLAAVDCPITDSSPPAELARRLQEADAEVVVSNYEENTP